MVYGFLGGIVGWWFCWIRFRLGCFVMFVYALWFVAWVWCWWVGLFVLVYVACGCWLVLVGVMWLCLSWCFGCFTCKC